VIFTGNYTQNFNSLGTSGVSWGNNTTLLGWTINSEAFAGTVTAGNGSSNAGAVYNYGATSNSDRSLGYLGSGANDFTNFYLQLQNNTGSLLTEISVSFDGRLWRSGGLQPGNSTNTLAFYYGSGTPTTYGSNVTTGWTSVSALNYAPVVNVAAGALSGAATPVSANITGLSVANGSSIFLRWLGNKGTGSDAGLAIDNLQVVPEPATWALIGLGAAFALWRSRRRAG